MRTFSLLVFVALPVLLKSQVVDTAKVIAEADSLLKLACTLVDQQELDKAFEINELAGTVISEQFEDSTFVYVVYLLQKGRILLRQSKYAESEPILFTALSLEEKRSGKNTLNYVKGLDYLGYAYWRLSRYDASEKALLEALGIGESVLGKEHEDYLSALDHLANLYRQIGRNEDAKAHCMEALSIKAKVFGKVSEAYSSSLTTLAAIYASLGDLERSEECNLEALEIIEKVHGKEHQRYALILNNLAQGYIRFGNYAAAEPMLLEAKDIRLKVLGKEHVDYAETLGYLAATYSDMGAYEQSETYYLEARAILEKNQGKMNSDYALITNNNANLYFKMGKLEEAKALYLEALAIREKVYGKEHRFYASTLNNLAYLYLFTDETAKAEPFMLEANELNLKILGPNHFRYSYSLNHLVNLYWKKGQFEKANVYLEKSWAIQKSSLIGGSKYLSEQELRHYASRFLPNVYKTFSLAGTSPNSEFSANSYDLALFYKGYLQTTSKQIRRLVKQDSIAIMHFDSLGAYQARLAKEYAKRIPTQDSQLITDLENRSEQLEKELVRTIAGFGVANQQVQWQQIQQNLKAGEAAIEFVHYQLFKPDPTDTVMYAAMVLRPNEPSPQFVPLTTESRLAAILQKNENQSTEYINRLYAGEKVALYESIWQPLERLLEGAKVVYYSPTSLLHRLNLAAVTKTDHTTLGDHYQLIRLGSTRQLIEPQLKNTSYQDALLFGGIQYEMDSLAIFQSIKSNASEAFVSHTRGRAIEQLPFTINDSIVNQRNWKYLQWTDVEIDALEIILQDAGIKTKLKRGYAATEEAFKTLGKTGKSPSILHVSTHGFFFPDHSENEQSKAGTGFQASDHPMIRSGLIFAGGNYIWQTGHALHTDLEDGVLTAFEISQLDLSNTALVVLSACETGLGDIEGNEGVYGLQRAFKIAGARYLIMSLWQVPDFQTQELMTTFYLNWLEGKMSIPRAFSAAQVAIRKKYPDPFYWAGFVLIE